MKANTANSKCSEILRLPEESCCVYTYFIFLHVKFLFSILGPGRHVFNIMAELQSPGAFAFLFY